MFIFIHTSFYVNLLKTVQPLQSFYPAYPFSTKPRHDIIYTIQTPSKRDEHHKSFVSATKWTDAWDINFVIMRTNLKRFPSNKTGHSRTFKEGSSIFLKPDPQSDDANYKFMYHLLLLSA